jgi:hypothetical protein
MMQQANDEKLNDVINACHRVSNLLGEIYSAINNPNGELPKSTQDNIISSDNCMIGKRKRC